MDPKKCLQRFNKMFIFIFFALVFIFTLKLHIVFLFLPQIQKHNKTLGILIHNRRLRPFVQTVYKQRASCSDLLFITNLDRFYTKRYTLTTMNKRKWQRIHLTRRESNAAVISSCYSRSYFVPD
jgi:hypothetical protein